MIRRLGQTGTSVAATSATAQTNTVATAESTSPPRGFEPGATGKPRVQLDARLPHAEQTKPRGEFAVVPKHVETVTAALARLDRLEGVSVQSLGDVDGLPILAATVSGAPPPPGVAPKKVLITGGVHGSEPAGTMAAVELLALVAAHPENFAGLEFTVVPLVNPEGFRDGERHNENDDADLNREVELDGSVPREIRLVMPVLDRGPWNLALDLHASGAPTKDGTGGFFAIRTEGNDELLHDVMSEFAQTHPVLDQTTKRYDLVEPGVTQSHNTGTVKGYLFENGTTAAFTVEAPEHAELDAQVKGLVDVAQGFLKRVP